jgi:hypothetical protein
MKETNLNIFYHLGATIEYMFAHISIGMDAGALILDLSGPQPWLEEFIKETEPLEQALKDTRSAAQKLLTKMYEITLDLPRDWSRKMTPSEMHSLHDLKQKFLVAFEHDHRNLDVFAVTPKGIYSTRQLIENPENKFSEKVRLVLPPQCIADLKEAGKCLAFEIPTACAFHVCRATEAVMLKYYEVLAGHTWTFKRRDWGIYIDQLRVEHAPASIINRLGDIRDDRNAYMHPEINVSLEEAPIVFEIGTDVIFQMSQEIQKKI